MSVGVERTTGPDGSPPRAERSAGEPPAPRPALRLTALDGLRGLAAFVVVLHHITLIATPLIQPAAGTTAPLFGLWWWLENTPLKLLSAGRESVLVFFVLSGLVVALPALKHGGFSWPGFLAGRFVRLYLPAWAAMGLAALLILSLPRDAANISGGGWLDTTNSTVLDWPKFLNEMTLMVKGPKYDNVLWTLQWEAGFSVLLPLLVLLAVVLRRWWLPVAAMVFGLSVLGSLIHSDPLAYFSVFFLGTLTAVHVDEVRTWGDHLTARASAVVWTSVVVGSALVLVLSYLLQPVIRSGTVGNAALQQFAVLGAFGLVIAAIAGNGWRRLLERAVPQFLGRISFSLYLVHVPLLVTIAYLIGDWNWLLLVPLAVPLAILVAWGFHAWVEVPLHRLARTANRASARAIASFAGAR